MELTKAEKEFMAKLNAYFENPLSDYSQRRVISLVRELVPERVVIKEVEKIKVVERFVTAPLHHESRGTIKLPELKKIITDYFKISELSRPTRLKEYVFARHCFFYFARLYTYQTLKNIAIEAGLAQDHTTVINGVVKIKNYIDTGDERADDVSALNRLIESHIKGNRNAIEFEFGKEAYCGG